MYKSLRTAELQNRKYSASFPIGAGTFKWSTRIVILSARAKKKSKARSHAFSCPIAPAKILYVHSAKLVYYLYSPFRSLRYLDPRSCPTKGIKPNCNCKVHAIASGGIDTKALPSDTFTNFEMHTFTDLVWSGQCFFFGFFYITFFQQPLLRLAGDGVSCLIWCLLIQSFNSSDHFSTCLGTHGFLTFEKGENRARPLRLQWARSSEISCRIPTHWYIRILSPPKLIARPRLPFPATDQYQYININIYKS